MLASLNRRFTTVEENKLLVLACFLDPRFKTVFFSDEATHQRATDWLEDEVAIDSPAVVSAAQQQEGDAAQSEGLFCEEYAQFVMEKGARSACGVDSGVDFKLEMNMYISEPLPGRGCNPLDWWKLNYHRFPRLGKLALKYLCAPPSTVPSERLFSEAGGLYDEKRNRLRPEKAEMVLMCRGNLPLLDFKY
ncbi:putative zinc finger BED domain-containing protein 4-like [Apostichopus japonicus]|uniref:Putative zinc finger BED domain-containing protein 4-like n=1 Tax=Stichopus japonicus TaxID=307972 RepID=A0A2G8KUM7_STIJA|nr:putative zinc finger BED domain-containing protein 4-like [Apostichopus japonicus]